MLTSGCLLRPARLSAMGEWPHGLGESKFLDNGGKATGQHDWRSF